MTQVKEPQSPWLACVLRAQNSTLGLLPLPLRPRSELRRMPSAGEEAVAARERAVALNCQEVGRRGAREVAGAAGSSGSRGFGGAA